MDIKKLKKDALKGLNKNWKELAIAVFILFLINLLCRTVGSVVCSEFVSTLLIFIIYSILGMGFVRMIVKTSNRKKVKVSEITSEANSFLKYMGITLVIGLIVGFLGLLVGVCFDSLVAVIGSYASMSKLMWVIFIIIGLGLTVALILAMIYMTISFSQCYFILNDEKEAKVSKVILKSFVMMEENVVDYFLLVLSFIGWFIVDYFLLVLSFIGWFIVGCLSFGLLFLWIIPYFEVTLANYYKQIKKEFESTKGEKEIDEFFE